MPLPPNRSSRCFIPGGCSSPGWRLGAQVRCPKQPSSCWERAARSSSPTQDCPQPREGPPWLDDDLSARCLTARAAWLAWRAPSVSLETRSLGTGIAAAGSLNINASLGSGNRARGEAGKPRRRGEPSSHCTTGTPGREGHSSAAASPGWGSWPWGPTKHPGFSSRKEKPGHGENQPAQVTLVRGIGPEC